MPHVQADVTEMASPGPAGGTLGLSGGGGQLSALRSFGNANFSGTEQGGKWHSNSWLWAVSNPENKTFYNPQLWLIKNEWIYWYK